MVAGVLIFNAFIAFLLYICILVSRTSTLIWFYLLQAYICLLSLIRKTCFNNLMFLHQNSYHASLIDSMSWVPLVLLYIQTFGLSKKKKYDMLVNSSRGWWFATSIMKRWTKSPTWRNGSEFSPVVQPKKKCIAIEYDSHEHWDPDMHLRIQIN